MPVGLGAKRVRTGLVELFIRARIVQKQHSRSKRKQDVLCEKAVALSYLRCESVCNLPSSHCRIARASLLQIYLYQERIVILMATKLKLTSVGTSTGVVIPKEMLNRMKVERGDTLHVSETPEGYLITPYDPAIASQVEAGREFMKTYRDTFKELAK